VAVLSSDSVVTASFRAHMFCTTHVDERSYEKRVSGLESVRSKRWMMKNNLVRYDI
jgi:hypothetical protein